MRASPALLAAALLAALAAPPATAQPGPSVHAMQAGDADLNQPIVGLGAAGLAYIDADADSRADEQSPDEPVYFDADGSLAVSYGDLRLTGFASYPAGTLVDATNSDIGRTLTRAAGWFATSPSGAWFADTDGSRSVTPGDAALGSSFSKVRPGDGSAGQALAPTQQQVSNGARVGYLDADNDGRRGLADPFVLDVDANSGATAGRTTIGDVLLRGAGPGTEKDTVTREELEEALGEAGTGQPDGGDGDDGGATAGPGGEAGGSGSAWGTPETILLLLGLANLVGLVFVYTRLRDGGSPRNPFK